MDDFHGEFCAEKQYPLVNHLRNSLGKQQKVIFFLNACLPSNLQNRGSYLFINFNYKSVTKVKIMAFFLGC